MIPNFHFSILHCVLLNVLKQHGRNIKLINFAILPHFIVQLTVFNKSTQFKIIKNKKLVLAFLRHRQLMRKYYAIFGRVMGNILPLEALYRVVLEQIYIKMSP
jgi:hypothetical protein